MGARAVTVPVEGREREVEGLPRLSIAAPADLTRGPVATCSRSTGRTAVVVVHGMGQQVRHENIDLVVRGLARAEARAARPGAGKRELDEAEAHVLSTMRARHVLLPGVARPIETQRAETTVGKDRATDVYEAYWAPLVEGEVTLRDVLTFLFTSGVRGFFASFVQFRRWTFGRTHSYGRPLRSAVAFVVALGVLAALLVANYLLYQGLSARAAAAVRVILDPDTSTADAFAGLVLVASAAAFVLLNLAVRRWLVTYVGDVAIYVTSHKLSRFHTLREKVRERVHADLAAVYAARDEAGFVYDRVCVVGHSLGSVVAYDALNRLLAQDALADAPLRVADRTGIFLTFGSPLDKTAFIFRNKTWTTSDVREALAASTQPLITSYDVRRFPWVNVWSSRDVISGALQYYDEPGAPRPPGVRNEPDPESRFPVLAHVQYWKKALVFDTLRAAILAAPAPPPPGRPPAATTSPTGPS